MFLWYYKFDVQIQLFSLSLIYFQNLATEFITLQIQISYRIILIHNQLTLTICANNSA